MLKRICLLILLILWAVPLFAQSVDTAWVRRYNGLGNKDDVSYAIGIDGSGNIYVTGESYGIGTGVDYTTIKYDASGNQLWVRRYNGPGDTTDWVNAMVVDKSCNIFVTGESYGSGTAFDYATVRYDESGNELWVGRYHGQDGGYDHAYAIDSDSFGNVYVTGHISWAYTGGDYLTIKYDSTGNEIWIQRYGSPVHKADQACCIAVFDSNNVYVTGSSWTSDTVAYDYVTIKYDGSGNEIWIKKYNGSMSSWDYARAIAIDNFNNIYITGSSRGSGTDWDYATIKYDSSGNELWVRRYNGSANWRDSPRGATVDTSGNLYVTGYSDGIGTSYDYATIKYYPNGDTAWVRRYNGPENSYDIANAITLDSSGNVYVGGVSEKEYTIVKYLADGDIAWVYRYQKPTNIWDRPPDIAVDGSGNVYLTGAISDTSAGWDYVTIRCVQYLRGDVTNNGEVNIGDAIYLIGYIFRSGPDPLPIFWVGDVNCNDIVDIVDVVYLTNYLFKKGPAPCN